MTRELYLQVLGLESNATWEEVQSAYAKMLERHLALESETPGELSSELGPVEEAFGFLIHDPVIQARRTTTTNTTVKKLASASVPWQPAETNRRSEWMALFALVACSLLLLIGALAFLNSNLEAAQDKSSSELLASIKTELSQVQKQNIFL